MTIEELKAKCAEEYSPEEFGETLERFIDEFKLEYVPKSEVDDCLSYAREEGWNLAKKIALTQKHGGYGIKELNEIFGTYSLLEILLKTTCSEAFKKINTWENRLKRWDEVIMRASGKTGIVVKVRKDDYMVVPYDDDVYIMAYYPDELQKTGKRMELV